MYFLDRSIVSTKVVSTLLLVVELCLEKGDTPQSLPKSFSQRPDNHAAPNPTAWEYTGFNMTKAWKSKSTEAMIDWKRPRDRSLTLLCALAC